MGQETRDYSPERIQQILEENRRLLQKNTEQARELTRLKRELTFDPITGLLRTQKERRKNNYG